MVDMDKVRKWPREHLEKRFHELDVHIDELERTVNDLEEMKSYRKLSEMDALRTVKEHISFLLRSGT